MRSGIGCTHHQVRQEPKERAPSDVDYGRIVLGSSDSHIPIIMSVVLL